MRVALITIALFLPACVCGALQPGARFACTTDLDCGPGFSCGLVGGARECVATATGGGSTGGGAGGGTGGGSSGGGGVGGGTTGGGVTGGGVTGGGVTGGGVTGGGTAGGGGTMGGGTGGGVAAQLAFVSPPTSVTAGSCNALVIETRDAAGLATPVSADTTLSLGGMPPSVGFFSANCAVPATPVIPRNASQVTVYFRATVAGVSSVTATAFGFSPANASFNVVADVPTKLVIVTLPQIIPVNRCSQPFTIEARDAFDNPAPVSTPTALLISGGGVAVTFFADSSCASVVASPSLAANTARLTLHFVGSAPSTVTLTVSALGLGSTMQTEVFTNGTGPDGLSLGFSGSSVLAGACVSASVTATLAGAPAPVSADTTVTLAALPLASVTFHTDAACATSGVTQVAIAAGAVSRDFYIRAVSGGTNTITATAPFGTSNRQLRVQSAVRRGTCTLLSTAFSTTCTVTPDHADLSHTLLVYQATSAGANTPGELEVRCRLVTVNSISCARAETGGEVTIVWQTLELPSRLNVQRGFGGPCPQLQPTLTPFDPTRSFITSSVTGVGTSFDGDDMTTLRLADGGVAFDNGNMACAAYEFQLADWAGLTVLRGLTPGFAPGSRAVSAVGLSPAGPNSIVLAGTNMVGGSAPNSASMCHFFTRAELDTPNTLRFTRGSTAINGCDNYSTGSIAWQRIDFGARANVQSRLVTLSQNLSATTLTLSPTVDPTRTLVFAGSQMASGLATGETAWNNGGNDNFSDVIASFELLSPSQVRVSRGDVFSTAQFRMYVVEVEP